MQKIILVLLLIFPGISAVAQKKETVYLNAKDSTSNLYIEVYPPKLPYKGCLFLIPGMFQKAQDVLAQTNLPVYAAQQGLLTIIPTFKTGIRSMGIDSVTQASLMEMLTDITTRHHLQKQKFFIGGFSIGGTCALKYAELSVQKKFAIKPSAVFAVDAPLDFERMYNTSMRETRLASTGKDVAAENTYMLKRYEEQFGGSPKEFLENYYKLSPYSFTDTTQYAIKTLVNLPIRFYTEPDVAWWMKDGVDYSGMNAFDLAAVTNELRSMGNSEVELIATMNRGYRKPGNKKNPHSWSIVEPKDLVRWLLIQ